MGRLPVSKLEVTLRLPTGRDQMRLLETQQSDARAALDLIEAVTTFTGSPQPVAELPAVDVEYLLLELRREVFGDAVRTDIRCPVRECRARIDVSFRIADYLAHDRAAIPSGVEPDDTAGWYRLRGRPERFRVPSAADQIAALDSPEPEQRLRMLCVSPAEADRRAVARVERALARMAPSLSRVIDGSCPECGARVEMFFDVPRFVLDELRDEAAHLYREVDRVAARYHWTEESILALPARRRAQYAEWAESGGIGVEG